MMNAMATASWAFHHTNYDDEDDDHHQHDKEVKSGVASAIVTTLQEAISVIDDEETTTNSNSKTLRPRDDRHTQEEEDLKLQIALLASSLAMTMQCSQTVLAEQIPSFESQLITLLQRITDMFLWPLQQLQLQHPPQEVVNTCQMALSSVTKIMALVVPVLLPMDTSTTKRRFVLVDLLFRILQTPTVQPDIRAEAAGAIAKCVQQQQQRHSTTTTMPHPSFLGGDDSSTADDWASCQLTKLIDEHASLLISTLSTATTLPEGLSLNDDPHNDDHDQNHHPPEDPSVGLYSLARTSQWFRCKMARRCCTVLVVARHLQHPQDPHAQQQALDFCESVLGVHQDPKASAALHCLCLGDGSNYRIIRSAILNVARDNSKATNARLQLQSVSLLERILEIDESDGDVMGIHECDGRDLMDVLRSLLYDSENDNVVIKASTLYCTAVENYPAAAASRRDEILKNYLWTVADLTTFPFEIVRAQALRTIQTMIAHTETALSLLESTEFLENVSLIIAYGCEEDRIAATDISRQLARSSLYHELLCRHADFLKAVIHVACQKPQTQPPQEEEEETEDDDPKAQSYCVDTLLALLSNKENTEYLLPFRNILPWLIEVVSTTTAEEGLKEQLVNIIIRLSSSYIDRP